MSFKDIPVPCHHCGGALHTVAGFAALRRVTSDCRAWDAGGCLAVCTACGLAQKPADAVWHAEAAAIYADYAIYHQSGGAEQRVFTVAAGHRAEPRSLRLLKQALPHLSLSAEGRMVDIGCGNGELLRSFSGLMPGWTLAGCELGDLHRGAIEAIPGVERLYVGSVAALPGRFDLVTMVHCLEHVPNPTGFLAMVREKLAPDGALLIEVPQWQSNAFDLVIADHCSHFTALSLGAVVAAAGFRVDRLHDDWIAKEMTLIARPAPGTERPVQDAGCADAMRDLRGALGWLTALAEQAQSVIEGPFGIFGTSIAGTWLSAQVNGRQAFFVDEDPARVGSSYLGSPVLAPDSVPAGAAVLVAQPRALAESIVRRLAGRPVRYVLPPEA